MKPNNNNKSVMGSEDQQKPLHIIFFPIMAAGHMIPMVDMAKLFAARGARATVVTTPANAPLIRASIDCSPDPITLHLIPFPSAAVGLPDGIENMSSADEDPVEKGKFLVALKMLRPSFEEVLAELRPDCAITDFFLPWTTDAAASQGVPRIVFYGTCFFTLCAQGAVEQDRAAVEAQPGASFVVPGGLPQRIEMLKSQLPDNKKFAEFCPEFLDIFRRMPEAESRSFGVVNNSFYELEPQYTDLYQRLLGSRIWQLGPVSLCNRDDSNKLARGNTASVDAEKCINWLAGRRRGSVIYVCFGSLAEFTPDQLREIAIGLEHAGHPFILAVRRVGESDWMPEGYEAKVEGFGLVVHEWAPQVLILGHEAVGGFMTHCGWNSCLEGLSAGVPMATWPIYAEQFYNERMIVDVLRVGMAVGAKEYALRAKLRPVVDAETVGRVVRKLMGGGEEAEGTRRRAAELGEKARRAVEEGGSSYVELGNLMKELMDRRALSSVENVKN